MDAEVISEENSGKLEMNSTSDFIYRHKKERDTQNSHARCHFLKGMG